MSANIEYRDNYIKTILTILTVIYVCISVEHYLKLVRSNTVISWIILGTHRPRFYILSFGKSIGSIGVKLNVFIYIYIHNRYMLSIWFFKSPYLSPGAQITHYMTLQFEPKGWFLQVHLNIEILKIIYNPCSESL